jgi:iron(III) transport system substrate-binding protein
VTPAQGAARRDWEQEWERVVAAAKQEGRVVISATPGDAAREALTRFQTDYPDIRAEATGALAAPFQTRLQQEREAGQFLWDLYVGGFGPELPRQVELGWLDPLKPALILPEVQDDAKWLGGFDAGFMDTAGQAAYAFTLDVTSNTYINHDLVPEGSFQREEDILDPRWKGRIAWQNPRLGGSGTRGVAFLLQLQGEGAVERLFTQQDIVFTDDRRQLAEWLVRGRYPIVVGVTAPDIVRFQREGLGLNVKPAKTGYELASPGTGGVRLLSRGPHPNATKVFVNWLLSPRGQTSWSSLLDSNSRRLDVQMVAPEKAADPAKVHEYVNLNKEDYMHLWVRADELARAYQR